MVAAPQSARAAQAPDMGDNNARKASEPPSEAEMNALFEAAMRQQQQRKDTDPAAGKTTVTPKEQQQFLSAMRDPEFRSLLNEYMQEISDPRHRAETEQYLSQLEKEQKVPADKQLVKPTPGFVLKTRWSADKTKVFVNVCSSDKLQPPSSTQVAASQAGGKAGTSWNLPYSLGPERLEADKGGASVPTFDACFHPRTLEFAKARADYRGMVAKTCLDAVEGVLRESRRLPTAQLSREYHVLKGVSYKSGDPVTMCLRKEAPPAAKPKAKTVVPKPTTQAKSTGISKPTTKAKEPKIAVIGEKENMSTLTKKGVNDDKSVLETLSSVEDDGNKAPLIQEVSSSKIAVAASSEFQKPGKKKMEFQLIYRGQFELLHHMQADPGKCAPADRHRPKELVVEVSFPLASNAKGLDLDVSERVLRLSTAAGEYEPLELALPFPVVEAKGRAKFDRKAHKLVVTLPVQPPPKPKPQSISLQVQDDDESEEEEEEEEVEEEEEMKSESIVVPEQEKQEASRPCGQPKPARNDEFLMLRETALMVAEDPQIQAHRRREAERSSVKTSPVHTKPKAVTRPQTVTEPTAIPDSMYDDLPPLEDCSDEEDEDPEGEEEIGGDETEVVHSSAEATEVDTMSSPCVPPFETQTTPTCTSYLVGVADIDPKSVELSFPSSTSLQLQFSALVDKKRQLYKLCVQPLPHEVDVATAEVDVASENMVVILQKRSSGVDKSTPEKKQAAVEIESPASVPAPLLAARFQNQLLYELD